jgi:gluconate 2-dehydrogenase gamma chain
MPVAKHASADHDCSIAMDLTRRHYLLGSIALASWPDIAAAQQHAHESLASPAAPRLESFDPATAADVAAIANQIIPSADGPGAREAGVIYFIDRALSTFDAGKRETYHKGMQEVHELRKKMFPDSTSIAALAPEQQIELIRAIETSEFFELLRTHTVLGFLGSPSYGGNRNQVGWKHIGFDDRMAFEPPFGYYDAEARTSEKK